jgi:NADH-quinone oxidoreductase subunit N
VTFEAPHIEWAYLIPVAVVLGAGVVGVLVEAFVPRRARRVTQVALALLATAAAVVAVASLWSDVSASGGVKILDGALVVDGPALVLQGVVALLGLVALLVVADRTESGEDAFAASVAATPGSDAEAEATRRGLSQTEVFPLVLFALGGMMLFPATADLLTLFVALEVLSLPLYLLAGMARRRRLLSQEASMKYFLLGAYASAFLLFGIALLYGFAGSVKLDVIAAAIGTPGDLDPMLLGGVVLVLVGLLFKVGAVPFHAWTPDAYQGAPTPITGFMGACTKVAAFGAMLRVVYVVLPPLEWDVMPALATIAIITMLVGTVVAIVQTDVKRMLAYSSIAHAGFILVGVVALTSSGISGVMVYLVAYGLATIGAFAVVSLVRESQAGEGGGAVVAEATHLSQWAGLGRRSPWLAGAFTLFLLSFAGIPLTAGFTGKFAVFSAAVDGGMWWLALIGVAASAAAVFFYVRLIVLMYFTDPAGTPGEGTTVIGGEGFTIVAIGAAVVGTILLGVLPSPVLELLGDAARFLP